MQFPKKTLAWFHYEAFCGFVPLDFNKEMEELAVCEN